MGVSKFLIRSLRKFVQDSLARNRQTFCMFQDIIITLRRKHINYETDYISFVFASDVRKPVLCIVAYMAGAATADCVAMDCRRGDGRLFSVYVPYLRRHAG